jgi:hypothetical protein
MWPAAPLRGRARIGLEDENESSFRPMEERRRLRSLVAMKQRLLLTTLALGLLVLAVGGWILQGLRYAPRALLTAVAQ